ncbi:hypothetical protein BDR07DRAFT_1484214 [Suillus spraguei]|nr:hypothetical protein BDR07DRAFT_1484214 [Suillus spraguei]
MDDLAIQYLLLNDDEAEAFDDDKGVRVLAEPSLVGSRHHNKSVSTTGTPIAYTFANPSFSSILASTPLGRCYTIARMIEPLSPPWVLPNAASKPSAKTNPNPIEIPISTSITELPDEEEEIFYDAIG